MPERSSKRYLEEWIRRDLHEKKMVFVGGPRQVGKTTLALSILGSDESSQAYFNWDYEKDRKRILRSEFPSDEKILVLDEIHKYIRWRNWLKGNYDKLKHRFHFLVTGSARLDYYRRGGDSLQGRYLFYRLHPLSLGELVCQGRSTFDIYSDLEKRQSRRIAHTDPAATLLKLMRVGGFPEPFYSRSERSVRRWRLSYLSRVLQEDVASLEKVMDMTLLELLIERLPDCVGSPLSLNALREDLQISHKTVARWIRVVENLYLAFRVYPFGASRIRAVKKESKLYLWDWGRVSEEGARFENLVACHLLKFCHFIEDTQGFSMELRYLRDTDGREVDFVVLADKKPWFSVETKLSDDQLHPALNYFSQRLRVPFWYQVLLKSPKDVLVPPGIRILPADQFLSLLV